MHDLCISESPRSPFYFMLKMLANNFYDFLEIFDINYDFCYLWLFFIVFIAHDK